jgi:hypothetical protein
MFDNFLFWRKTRNKKINQRHGKGPAARGVQRLAPYGLSPQIEPLEQRLMLSASPDLTVTAATIGAPSVEVGNAATLSLDYSVQNKGTFAPAQTWTDSFYLSSKTSLDQTALRIGSVTRADSGFPLAVGGSYTTSTILTIPNTALLGNQYLLVVTDPADSINESNTANNTIAVPIQLTAANVDLAVSNPAVTPGSLVAGNGATATVSWTVTNNGGETAAASWSDGVYLSSKTTLDATAVRLGEFKAPATLAAGGGYTQSEKVTIPNTSLLGAENVLIVADDSGEQSQSSTANATAAAGVSVALPASLADLQVKSGSVTVPAAATLGQTIPVSWTVTNSGSGPASGTWTDVVYASPTPTFNAATAINLGGFAAPATLAVGASYTQTQSVGLSGASASDNYILIVTDNYLTQAESNNTNNVGASAAITLSAPTLPSLAIVAASFTVAASANLGQTIPVSWSVQNTSAVATTSAWSDELYVSDKSSFDTSAQLIGTYAAPIAGALATGASYNQAVEVTLPYTQTGSRYLLLVADGNAGQAVSNSTPIVASSPITLAAPDLVVAVKQAPSAAVLGAPFTVSWTVTNTGSVPAASSWQDGVYISGTSGFDPATAQLLTTVTAPSTLAAGASYTTATTVTLPSLAAGNYDLYFVADNNNDQGKINASIDNVASSPITVTGPNFSVKINSAPAAAVASGNNSIELSWTVTNNSATDAMGTWSDAIYLSPTPTLNLSNYDTTYWELGDFNKPLAGPLNAGGSYTELHSMTIPVVPAAGTYYLIVEANYYGSQPVTSTANETASAAISLTLPAVNLVVTTATPSATALVAGGSYTVDYTVQNQGSDPATASDWYDEIFLSSKQTFDNSASYVGEYYYSSSNPLLANGTYSASVSITVAASASAGPQYLLIVPDTYQSQAETNTNNAYAVLVTVTLPDVKLAASITSSPASEAIGSTFAVSWKVTNTGTAATTASYWYDYIYLSTSPTPNDSEINLASTYVGSLPLAPGGSYTETQNVTLSQYGLTAGTYYLLVSANLNRSQAESDTSQNVASAPLTVTGGSPNVDLVISSATAPAAATPSQSVALSYTVKNQGTDAATSVWYDYVYLSNSPTINSYSTYVGDFAHTSALNGGATYTANETVTLPSNLSPGNDYLVFETNEYGLYGSGQTEINFNNNTYALPIAIGEAKLAVTAASFTGTGVEGSPVSVSWTVQNQGTVTASATWYDAIYLSDAPVPGAGSQIYLGEFSESSHSPLAPQGTYSATQSVTLPASSLGPRYLLVVTDVNYILGALDRSNNYYAVPITLTVPNLAVSAMTATPASVEAGNGGVLNIQWTATNTSSVNTSQGWYDEVFLSPTPSYDPSTAVYLTEAASQTDLAAGASYTTKLTNVALSNHAPGSYYVVVIVNYQYYYAVLEGYSSSGQPESDPSDNIASSAVTLTAPAVNLVVSNPTVASTSLLVGQSVNFSFQVTNQGSETAQSTWNDGVYISAKSTYDSSAQEITYLYASNNSPLAAGASYTQSTSTTIPQDLAAGQYYLYFVTNTNKTQAESNYADDVSAPQAITVNVPDLTIAVSSPPNSAKPSESVSVSYTVTNNSAYDTTSSYWYDYVYFSSQATYDYTATELSYRYISNSPPLAAGKSYTQTQTFTIPADATIGQQYYLLFLADQYQTQGVSNTADQLQAVPITIVATDVNLQVATGSVTAPPAASIGAPVTVGWSVNNTGTDSADGPWQDYVYLSSSSTFDSTATLVDEVSTAAAALPLAGGGSYTQSATFSFPSGTATGSYYLYVEANGNAAQAETTTSDNVSAALPITITTPDLQATSVTAPASATWGTSISVSWTVQNNGAGAAAGTWYDAVYVSSKTQFDSTAQYVANFYEGQNLAAGGQYSDTRTVSLTGVTAPITGPAYILVVPNYENYLNESSTANSSGASGQIALAAPDLVLTAATAPTTAVVGDPINVTWTVKNQSTVDAPAQWYDAVYISPDNVVDSHARLIQYYLAPTNPLVAGDSYTQSQTLTVPVSFTGPEYLLFVANNYAYSEQPETNLSNNTYALPIDLSAAQLATSIVTAPNSAAVGQTVSVSWTVKNTGTGPADQPWSDGIYLSLKNTLDSSATLLASVPAGSDSPLAAGASYTHTAQVALNLSTISGSNYYLYVAADDGYQQLQTSRSGDVVSQPITLAVPDLSVKSVVAPAGTTFGQPISVSWTVQNTGAVPAAEGWSDAVYYSTKNTLDSSATLLTTLPAGSDSPLAAGGSYTHSAQVTLPLTAQSAVGPVYILVDTDYLNQQAETNENNNVTASASIAAALPALPDLVPASLSLPATGYNGQNLVPASWIDANNGTAAAAGPWVDDIYLASDAMGDNAALVGQATYSGTLAAGQQTVQLTQPITLPDTPGTYYLVVVADASGINEGPFAVQGKVVDPTPINVVQTPLPDLVVTSVTPPSSAVLSGNTVPISFVVKNQGTAPTSVPVWHDWVVLSQDPNLLTTGLTGPLGDQILNNQPVVLGFANPSYLDVLQSYTQTVDVPLPINAQGTWYAYVMPDGTGGHHPYAMPELSRSDKLVKSAAFTVNLSPPADLSLAGAQTAPQAFSGQPTTVSWTVNNIGQGTTDASNWPVSPNGEVAGNYSWGSAAASTWTDAVYMSPDQTLDSNAVLLGTFSHYGPLNAGAGYTNSQQVTLPVGASGSFYFIVDTDVGGQVFENGATANNVGATPAVTVNLTPPPDLKTSILSSPATALASHALTFTYQVSNTGAGATALLQPADKWTDAFYLSPTATYNSATAISLGTQDYNQVLQAGGSYQDTITELLPNALSGSYYLIVNADSLNSVFELDQAGKIAATASKIQVASQPADLAVTTANATASGPAGGAVLVNWTVANNGTGDSAVTSWQDNVYADTGTTLSANAVFLGSFTHNGLLAAGGSYSQSQLVALPINLSGPYNLFVVTNEPGQGQTTPPVYESNFNNDTSAAVPITVAQSLAALQATSVTAPAAAQAGTSATINWTVTNNGAGATNVNYWYDDIWLSTKTTLNSGGNDVYLSTVEHSNPLAAGGNYSTSATVTVPTTLAAGTYYFIVAVDRPVLPPNTYNTTAINRVYQSSYANSETAAAATTVTLGPNLVVSAVTSPSTVNSGQQLTVGWTVTNNGAGGTGNIPIEDSVFLSYDQVLSNSSIYVGSAIQYGGLAAGGSYTQSATFNLRSGLIGTFYLFVETDTNDNVYEQNSANAVVFDTTPLVIQPVAPADLVAGTVTIPANAVPGQNITISYQVSNDSANPAAGVWTDSLYLSPTQTWSVSDPLLGQVVEIQDLASGGSYTGTLTAPLPGVDPGSYYVIVRTNILDSIPETTLANNLSASLKQTSLAPPALTLGTPATGTLGDQQSAFYQVAVTAGQTLQFSFASQEANSLNELYVSLGSMPSRGQADYSFQQLAANQQTTVPTTQAGTYYILAYGNDVPGLPESYSMTAAVIPFSVTAVSPASVGNAGRATLEIDGAKFDRGTTFQLIDAHGNVIQAAAASVQDAATAFVTFDLTGQAVGQYAVQATAAGGATTTLAAGLMVTAGTGANLQVGLSGPAKVLPNAISALEVNFTNTGDADSGAPLIFMESPSGTAMGFTSGSVPYNHPPIFLAVSANGPAGVLRPGYHSSRQIFFKAPGPLQPNDFQYVLVAPGDTDAIAWSEVLTWIPPSYLQSSNWPAAAALLQQEIGGTWGGFVQLLDSNAALVVPGNSDPSNVGDDLTIAVKKALAAVSTSLSGSLQAANLSLPVAGVTIYAANTATQQVVATQSLNDGSFIFPSLPAGSYMMSVQGGLVTSGASVTVGSGQAVSGVTLALAAGADISGQVFSNGSSVLIAGATVTAINEAGGQGYVATSDAKGNYNLTGLSAGVYDLVINAAGYARTVLAGVDVTHVNAIETVNMAPEAVFVGTITLGSGGPARGTLQVFVQPSGNTDPNQFYETTSTLSSFTLGGLPGGTYDVTLTMPGYISQTLAGVSVPAGASTNLGAIALAPASEIDGTVNSTDPNNLAGGIEVQALKGAVVAGSAMADASGNFQILNLPPGTYTLSVPTAANAFVTAPTITVATAQTVQNAAIQVQPGGVIGGGVTVSGTTTSLPGMTVYLAGPSGQLLTTTTDTNGNYQFPGLGTGSYQVYLLLGGSQAAQSVTVTKLDGSIVTANLQIAYAASIGGTLSDGAGNPITDGVVTLDLSGNQIATAQTDATGAYKFLIAQPGTFDLLAASGAATFAPATGVAVAAGASVTENFQSGSGTLGVTVTDANQPVAGDVVELASTVAGAPALLVSATVGTSGTASFVNLAAGDYTVVVQGANGDSGQTTVTVPAAGAATTSVTLAVQAAISGTITDSNGQPVSGAAVILQSPTDPQLQYTASTAADGTYSIAGITPGTYDVTSFAPGLLAATRAAVTVTTTATVNIALSSSTTTITGKLVDASNNAVPSGEVTVFDAAGHAVGFADVQADGSFQVTTAQGSGLTLSILAQGYAPPATAAFNAPAGGTTALGAIVLQAVAIDPAGSGPTGQQGTGSDGQAWADQVKQEAQDILSQIQNVFAPIPPPTCPDCEGAYDDAVEAQQELQKAAADVTNQAIGVGIQAVNLYVQAAADVAAIIGKVELVAAAAFVASRAALVLEGAGVWGKFVLAIKDSYELVNSVKEAQESLDQLQEAVTELADAPSEEAIQNVEAKSVAAVGKVSEAIANAVGVAAQIVLPGEIEIGALKIAESAIIGFKLDQAKAAISGLQAAGSALTGDPFANTVKQAVLLKQEENDLTQNLLPAYDDAQSEFSDAMSAYDDCQATATCNQPNPPPMPPMPRPAPQPMPAFPIPPEPPHDPNNIIGPAGFGDENFVTVNQTLPYQIDFENEPTAGLPAQQVTITQQLDSNLNWQSFRLGSFGFGGTTYTVPANRAYYQTQIDLTQTNGYLVDVTATIDERTGVATWTFTTIDPATGQIPLDPSIGFLPPDNADGIGEGFVSYTVMANASAATGTVINAQATVDFYTQPPINTPQIFNTIDAGSGLTSSVAALPVVETLPDFNVSWSGSDNYAGSAIADYSIYVSDNGGAYTAWLSDTTLTSGTYTGQASHTYDFYSVAGDNAGNVQATPSSAQAVTTVAKQTTGVPPTVTGVSPALGLLAGGTTVTITGTGFTGATAVDFGGLPASSFSVNPAGTQITATSPASMTVGPVDVSVTAPGGVSTTSTADQFRYSATSIVGMSSSGAWWMAHSNGSSFANQSWDAWSPAAGWQDVQVGDFTGNGEDDIVGRTSNGEWYVAFNTGTSFVNQPWGSWDPTAGWKDVQVADVTGDGKADIVGMTSYGAWYVAVSNGSSFTTSFWGAWDPAAGWQNVHVAKATGNGMADIVARATSGAWYVAVSNGTSFTTSYWGAWSPAVTWSDVQFANFTGNGMADIAAMTPYGAWYVAVSNGTSFTTSYWGAWDPTAGWQDVQAANFTGNGMAGIAGMTTSGQWYVAVSNGTSFTTNYWGAWDPTAGWQDVQAADVNGDGKTDLVGMTSYGAWYAAVSSGTSFTTSSWGSWNPGAGWQPVLVGQFG